MCINPCSQYLILLLISAFNPHEPRVKLTIKSEIILNFKLHRRNHLLKAFGLLRLNQSSAHRHNFDQETFTDTDPFQTNYPLSHTNIQASRAFQGRSSCRLEITTPICPPSLTITFCQIKRNGSRCAIQLIPSCDRFWYLFQQFFCPNNKFHRALINDQFFMVKNRHITSESSSSNAIKRFPPCSQFLLLLLLCFTTRMIKTKSIRMQSKSKY
jgi:hypothetical protein